MGRSVPGVPVAGPAIPAIPGVVLAAGLMAGPVGAQVGVPVAGRMADQVAGLMAGPVGVPMVVLAAGLVAVPMVVLAAGLVAVPMVVLAAGPIAGPMVDQVVVLMDGASLAAGLTIAPIWTGDAEGRTQRVRAPGAGWRGVEPVA